MSDIHRKAHAYHHRQLMTSARNCSFCWNNRAALAERNLARPRRADNGLDVDVIERVMAGSVGGWLAARPNDDATKRRRRFAQAFAAEYARLQGEQE